ncbi:MAG: cupredoxin domain-containing protein [Nitrosopumilus sp.]
MRIISLASISFLISLSTHAFAQTSYDVNIPPGAASPDAPYFWQSEKDGSTSGIIEILVGDTVVWKNADIATHTVTAITESEENTAFI